MSNQAWVLEKMIRHGLQVDFNSGIIECRGFSNQWTWGFAEQRTFYEALQEAIEDITKREGF